MKAVITGFFVSFTLCAQMVFAHGDHYELTSENASESATIQVAQLSAESKLPATWKEAKVLSAESKMLGGKKRWVVTLQNDKEADATKKKLEVALTPAGKLVSHQFLK